jgi:hypothetical protein
MGTGQYEQKLKFQELCGLHLKQRCLTKCPWAFFCPPRLFQMSTKTFSNARKDFFKFPPRLFQMPAKTFSNARQDFFKCPPRLLHERTNYKSDIFHSKCFFLSNNQVKLPRKLPANIFCPVY